MWVQISDCPDWEKVAAGVSQSWGNLEGDGLLREIAEGLAADQPDLKGLEAPEAELLVRIEKALRLVQDEYRYLSIDLEVGGHVPSPPETVARRRFGDCKDLSFLLVQLLKLMGVLRASGAGKYQIAKDRIKPAARGGVVQPRRGGI